MHRLHVVLVPGFFGFDKLSELGYFRGVHDAFELAFWDLGVEAEVHCVPTLPTASIQHRAARVRETLAKVAASDDAPIHIVGHSTGALDARVAIAPTADLPTQAEFHAYQRVATVVSIAAPHHGTPLATVFGGTMGKPLLRLLALAAVRLLEGGGLPLGVMLRLGQVVSRLDDLVGAKRRVVDQLYEQLLGELDDERRARVVEFLDGISSDQSLVFQLTPAGCDLLNACTGDPDGVRYGCVLTRGRPPRPWTSWRDAHDVYSQTLYGLYAVLYAAAARSTERDLPVPSAEQRAALVAGFGDVPTTRDNDGIVPTRSQLWGQVIHCTDADHLDVVGHYGEGVAHVAADWLPSKSGFDRAAFDRLWGDVARFVAGVP